MRNRVARTSVAMTARALISCQIPCCTLSQNAVYTMKAIKVLLIVLIILREAAI